MKNTALGFSDWVSMGLLSLGYLVYTGFLLPIGSDDLRMTNVFSIDESDIVAHVWNLFITHFQVPPSFKYGGMFYAVPVGLLHLCSLFFSVSEQTAIVAVRLYCSMSGLGCLWMTFLLGRWAFDSFVGFISASMLGLNPTFLRWAIEAHPDLPQLFFLLASLLCICKYSNAPTLKRLVWASLGAGLAFATKYAGIFLLPVFGLAVYWSCPFTPGMGRLKTRGLWIQWSVVAGVFTGVYLLTNPFVFSHFSELLSSLRLEKETMGFGHRIRATTGAWVWLHMVVMQVGMIQAGIGLLGAVGWFFWYREPLAVEHKIVLLWVAFFLLYLMAESSLKRARHLLPILPVVLVFIAAAYRLIWQRMTLRFP
jgi:4-amino-4-deoxy-L-arabinose transferase-like glycosyltransferase